MIETVRSAAVLISIALIPVGILLVIQHLRMLRLLETNHPELWNKLGSPRLWFSPTITETTGTLGFLWRRAYRLENDPALSSVCGFVRALHLLFAVMLAASVVMFGLVLYYELGLDR